MGIQGLIPFLDKASRPVHISEFSGSCIAIDAYCWLHKGVFSCADKLARGEPCEMYVTYCLKYINMLLSHNIKPILVFDGQRLPAKADTERKRRENREVNRKKAMELLRLDRAKEAQTYLRRSVDITHGMALKLIQECRKRNVDCIVAPYEADAQLAFLSIQNIAQVVVTEDSDLLLFGARKVVFKMDINGNGLCIEQENLHIAMGVNQDKFSMDKFRHMCILSGCDYLSSLPGIGLVKASRFIKKSSDDNIHRAITRLGSCLNMSQLNVTLQYRDDFVLADSMFKYQPVFDPISKLIVPLTTPSDDAFMSTFNHNISPEDAIQLAYGNIDPSTLKQVDDWSPAITGGRQNVQSSGWTSPSIAPHPSIWSANFTLNSLNPRIKPPTPDAFNVKNTACRKMVVEKIPLKQESSKRDSNALEREAERLIGAYQLPGLKQIDKKAKCESNYATVETPKRKESFNPWVKNIKTPDSCSQTGALTPKSAVVRSRYFSQSSSSTDSELAGTPSSSTNSEESIQDKEKCKEYENLCNEQDSLTDISTPRSNARTPINPFAKKHDTKNSSIKSGIFKWQTNLSYSFSNNCVLESPKYKDTTECDNKIITIHENLADDTHKDVGSGNTNNMQLGKCKARSIGLSKKKPTSKQSLLSNFGFRAPEKLKV